MMRILVGKRTSREPQSNEEMQVLISSACSLAQTQSALHGAFHSLGHAHSKVDETRMLSVKELKEDARKT